MSSVDRLKSLLSFLVLLFAWGAAAAGPAIQSWTTANGARVLFVPAPALPILDLRVVFDAAASRDGDHPGVASLTNALLTQGAGAWDADTIAERIESVGSTLETGSLRDMAWVSARTLTRDDALATTLETLAKVLAEPRFPPRELERVRKAVLVSLRQEEQRPGKVGKKAWYRLVFGDHPYAHDPSGTPESVEALTRDDLLAHYRRYYVARNAVISLVGAIDRAQAERIAETLVAGLPAGEPAPPLPPVADPAGAKSADITFPSTQAHLYTGQPGMARKDPDYFPLYVGNHILGGAGLVSILADEVREKRGLSYSVSSYFIPMRRRGPFLAGLQTKASQLGEAERVLRGTIRRFLREGPTEKELDAAKKNLTGGFPLRISSNAKIAEYLSLIGFYDLPLDYLDRFTTRIEAVTREQIRDAFRRRIHPDRFATVRVGPGGKG